MIECFNPVEDKESEPLTLLAKQVLSQLELILLL